MGSCVVKVGHNRMSYLRTEKDEMGEDMKKTEYAIKQVGDRYYPVIIDREAGGHYEIKNPLTGGSLSYNNPEAAKTYIKRARMKEQG
jgi:predicted aspartyl protease